MSDAPIKLDRLQRQMLYNQFEVIERVTGESCKEQKEILLNGYELFYGDLFVVYESSVSEADCVFVLDVLSAYRLVHIFIEQNPTDTEVNGHHRAKFIGFDGNNETKLMAFTRFLVHEQNKFEEARNSEHDDFNSHSPMRDVYAPMVREYKARKINVRKMSRDDILGMLNAK